MRENTGCGGFLGGRIETMLGHTEIMCYKLLILVRTRMTHGSYNIPIYGSMWRCGMKLKFQHILHGDVRPIACIGKRKNKSSPNMC